MIQQDTPSRINDFIQDQKRLNIQSQSQDQSIQQDQDSSLPPMEKGEEYELGEYSEQEIRSISVSVDKENNINDINTHLREDNFDIEEGPYKKFQNSQNQFTKSKKSKFTFQKPISKITNVKNKNYNQVNNPNSYRDRKECLEKALTLEEGNALLEMWRKSNFLEFNSWVQIAKAAIQIDYQENQSLMSVKKTDGYSCSIKLVFNANKHGELNDFVGNGFGKSKKVAKFMAMERLVTDLIQTGLIRLGLRDRKFFYEYKRQTQEKSNQILKSYQEKKEIEDQDKISEKKYKIIKKAVKQMQDMLFQDNFPKAIEQLQIIADIKEVEWKELNFIWCYALKEQNIEFLKQIVDILAFDRLKLKKVNPFQQKQTVMIEPEEAMTSAQYVKNYHSDKVKQRLFQYYALTREASENQYEFYDSYVLEINDSDIRPNSLPLVPEDELEKQVISDPLNRDINQTLVQPQQDKMSFDDESPIKEIDQKNIIYPGAEYKDPFEQNKSAQEREYNLSKKQQDSIYQNMAKTIKHPELLREIQDIENENTIVQGSDDFVVYKKGIDRKTQYVPKELLDELYESLIYSGDLNMSLIISEKIYTKLKIKDQGFLHPHACDYYMQKKNAMMVQMLDKVYDVFSYNKPRNINQEYLCTLNGSIHKTGSCHSFDTVVMEPIDSQEILESKLLKRARTDISETSSKIIEGDIVILTTFFQPSYEKPILKEQTSKLANYINTKSKNSKEQSQFIHSITEFGNTVEFAYIAHVKEITVDNKLKISLTSHEKVQDAFKQKDTRMWKITKLASRFDYFKMYQGLREFCQNPKAINNTLFHILLTPPTQTSEVLQKFSETPDSEMNQYVKHQTSLNPSQLRAVQSAACQMLTLVQGPPGSGKTTVCIEIIIEWLRQSGKPILVTAENDQNVEKLFNELMKANVKAVKLAPGFEEVADTHFKSQRNRTAQRMKEKKERLLTQQEQFQEQEKLLENENFDEDIILEQQEYFQHRQLLLKKCDEEEKHINQTPINQKFMFLKRLLREAPVVVTKTSSVQSDYLKGLTFFRVIVDEAHRVSETLALSAMVKNCQKLVLVGDSMSPGIPVTSMIAASKGYNMSLLDKFIMQKVKPITLTEQYKLPASLVTFPSFYFYKNKVETIDLDQDQRNVLQGFKWPDITIKNSFVFVKGNEILAHQGVQNLKEIEVIMEILMQMLKAQCVRPNQVVIFTTTEEQKKRIRTEITYQARKLSSLFGLTMDEVYRINKHSLLIDVDTIDKAQFYDKDLVLFSPVRSNKHGGLGILRDPRMLNSLLWSGNKGLIIVGDMETLQQDVNWAEYIKWLKKNKLIQYYITK